MDDSRPRHRLRSYLVAVFIPLAGLPLLALAGLTYFFVSRAVNQEISRRAAPELATIARNLETVERRLTKQLTQLAREDDLKISLITADKDQSESIASEWIAGTQFDAVRIYGNDGIVKISTFRSDRPHLLQDWQGIFSSRKPASLEAEENRKPSTASVGFIDSGSRFDNGRLSKNFQRFLRTEDNWIYRDIGGDPSRLRLVTYKLIADSESKPIGYLEGFTIIDDAKLKILAEFQGLDLTIVRPNLSLLAASTPEAGRSVVGSLALFSNEKALDLRNTSREVQISGQPVEFFFAPVQNDNGVPVAWLSVGLSKESQVEFRNNILLWMAILVTLMTVVVIYLTVSVSSWITRPVTDLVKAVDSMQAGEWVQPVSSDSKTEMGYLVKRFNEMAMSVQVTKRTLETKLGELAQAHEAITQTQGQLVQSAKLSSLGQLVAGVAHELNNPIAFIYSNMSQMKQYVKNLETLSKTLDHMRPNLAPEALKELEKTLEEIEWDYVRKDMDDIVKSCLEGSIRVKDIVLGLRNFSRLDQGQFAEADLHQALQNTVKLLSSEIRNRVSVHWELTADARIPCNVSQINQVLMNLIANALQAIEGKGDLWIRTWIDESNTLAIGIRDSGKGIPQEHMDRIFDPFFTTKKVGDGTGLGLSIVYGIIQRHGGTIEVKSRTEPSTDHGTEFIVKLPRQFAGSGETSGNKQQAS